jgi:hypothetical protein
MNKFSQLEWDWIASACFGSFGDLQIVMQRENPSPPTVLTDEIAGDPGSRYMGDLSISLQPKTGATTPKIEIYQYLGAWVKVLEFTNTSATDYRFIQLPDLQFQRIKICLGTIQFIGYHYSAS